MIVNRADAEKQHIGLTTWKDAPQGKIQKFDVSVAKNYLAEDEMAQLARLVNAYGSNITNIALILGVTALISPIAVHSQVLRKELPIFTVVTALAVVGIAGAIHPMAVGPEVFSRDILVMAALTLSLFVIGNGFRGLGRINRIEGAVLLACYVGYTAYLISTVFGGQA